MTVGAPGSRPRVVVRLPAGWAGDLPEIYADGAAVAYVIDERAPNDRVYEMTAGDDDAINALLLGGTPPERRRPALRLVTDEDDPATTA